MTLSAGYSNEQIIEIVESYMRLPWGQKGRWLAEQSISQGVFRRWRLTYEAGTIDVGLVPRYVRGMVTKDNGVSTRTMQDGLARQRAEYEGQIAQLQERIEALQAGNEALGKAIGFLRENAGQESEAATEQSPSSSNSTDEKRS